MRLIDRARGIERATLEDIAQSVAYAGNRYGFATTMPGSPRIDPPASFDGYVSDIHQRYGVVAAAVLARQLLVSELRFVWRDTTAGATGGTFGSPALGMLAYPSPSLTRPQMLSTMEAHASYGGAAYVLRLDDGSLSLLNPGHVYTVLGTNLESDNLAHLAADARVVGYIHDPKRGTTPKLYAPSELAAWIPEPDPVCWWRGISWITSVLDEIATDRQASNHLSAFYTNAATPQMVYSFDASLTPEQVSDYASLLRDQTVGTANAYKSLIVGGGADVEVVGDRLAQLNYRDTQGGHESRIASRSRVPAAILGIREGMQGSALNSGNYTATRRLWADTWFSPYAASMCAAMERILPVPGGAELTFDRSQVQFLQEDRADEANIMQAQSQTLRNLVDGGFDATSAVAALVAGDFSKLKHSGLYSVQMQAPGSETPVERAEPVSLTVNIPATEVTIDSPVTVERTEITVAPAESTITVPVTVERGLAPNVTIDSPITVEGAVVNLPEPKATEQQIQRDAAGNIVSTITRHVD